MPKTVRYSYLFKVSEYGDGTPFISLEARDSLPPELKDLLVAFNLKDGTKIERASEIASFLNANLADLALTNLVEK